jgi:hypothetical protein
VSRRVLHGRPLIGREGFDGPLAVEATDTRVFLAAEGTGGQIDYGLIVDVHHPDLHLIRKSGVGCGLLRTVENESELTAPMNVAA